MKYKKGMILQSITSGIKIKLVGVHSGNGHWVSIKLPKAKKSHKIHEGTLNKFYKVVI